MYEGRGDNQRENCISRKNIKLHIAKNKICCNTFAKEITHHVFPKISLKLVFSQRLTLIYLC